MPISSNALFHYTDKLSTIENILRKGFQLSLCQESVFAIPMISFCDVPISNANYYFDNYGSYAIGMNLDWAIRNKLNPVLYIEKSSYLSDKFNAGYKAGVEIDDESFPDHTLGEYNTIIESLLEYHRYTKPFKGELIRKGKVVKKDYKFYDEREWRYIPEKSNPYFPFGLRGLDYENFLKQNQYKPHFKEQELKFDADDIKYIIIKDKSEVPKIISFLMSLSNLGSPNDIQQLFPKILIANQIIEDF